MEHDERASKQIRAIKDELVQLSGIRHTLVKLKDRMLRCKTVNKTEFRKRLWPREHLWDTAELYTLHDLIAVAKYCNSDHKHPLELRDLLVGIVFQCQTHLKSCKGGAKCGCRSG